jgi:hypothetical protein
MLIARNNAGFRDPGKTFICRIGRPFDRMPAERCGPPFRTDLPTVSANRLFFELQFDLA